MPENSSWEKECRGCLKCIYARIGPRPLRRMPNASLLGWLGGDVQLTLQWWQMAKFKRIKWIVLCAFSAPAFLFEKRVKHVSQMVGLPLHPSLCVSARVIEVNAGPPKAWWPPGLHRLWMSSIMSQFIQVFHMCVGFGVGVWVRVRLCACA